MDMHMTQSYTYTDAIRLCTGELNNAMKSLQQLVRTLCSFQMSETEYSVKEHKELTQKCPARIQHLPVNTATMTKYRWRTTLWTILGYLSLVFMR